MSSTTTVPAPHSLRTPRARIAYLDAARALAIIGMFLAHIAPFVNLPSSIENLVSGRSAIMFAVLAGVSTVLIARSTAVTDHERLGYISAYGSRNLMVRAVILFLLGITLPLISRGPIIILSTYAVLFLLAIPVLRLSTRVIVGLAAITAIVTPLLSFWFRTVWPDTSEEVVIGGVPDVFSFTSAEGTLQALRQLTFDGMYPVLTWIPFLLAGIVIGRVILDSTYTTRLFAIVGVVLAVIGYGTSLILVKVTDVMSSRIAIFRQLEPSLAGASDKELMDQFGVMASTDFGVSDVTDARSLLLATNHSGSITEIVGGIGFTLVVFAVLSVIEHYAAPLLTPISNLGKMSLTYYVAHVIGFFILAQAEAIEVSIWLSLMYFVIVPMLFAALWFHFFRRGPLEAIMHAAAQGAHGSPNRTVG